MRGRGRGQGQGRGRGRGRQAEGRRAQRLWFRETVQLARSAGVEVAVTELAWEMAPPQPLPPPWG